jgi:hypothetical protein
MQNIISIWNQISDYINIAYLCTFMALAYMVKTYFQVILAKVIKKNVPFVYVVLILATIVAVPFLLTGASFVKVLFAYAIGTSLHEVFLTWIEKAIKKVTGATDPVIIIKYLPAIPDKGNPLSTNAKVSVQEEAKPEPLNTMPESAPTTNPLPAA